MERWRAGPGRGGRCAAPAAFRAAADVLVLVGVGGCGAESGVRRGSLQREELNAERWTCGEALGRKQQQERM